MIKVLKVEEVIQLTRLSRSTINRLKQLGKFPEPIRLSDRSIGWLEDDIQGWILNARDQNARATTPIAEMGVRDDQ
jgi:prophage regulatory protein